MEKQRLLYQQSRLHNRGAAEMVLQMISACKGAFTQALLPSTRALSPLPLGHHLLWTSWRMLPPCTPVLLTLALARSTCLAISHSSFPLVLRHSLLPTPWGRGLLVGGKHSPQTERAIFCPPPPPGETGAMVSSTLKLGISILNGGNADVQQVTDGTWELG